MLGHESKERDLLKLKEEQKFKQMQNDLINARNVSEFRQGFDKQILKLK
jgi:hypothetical protein